jgi:hypothetical protein
MKNRIQHRRFSPVAIIDIEIIACLKEDNNDCNVCNDLEFHRKLRNSCPHALFNIT